MADEPKAADDLHPHISQMPAMREEIRKLRDAIKAAGFGIMQTSGDWSICDVSKKAQADQEREADTIADNIDLRIALENLVQAQQNVPNEHRDAQWLKAYIAAEQVLRDTAIERHSETTTPTEKP